MRWRVLFLKHNKVERDRSMLAAARARCVVIAPLAPGSDPKKPSRIT